MKGCIFAVVFAVAAMVLFALLAPLLFRGADMQKTGQAAGPLVALIGGVIGYLFGRSRKA